MEPAPALPADTFGPELVDFVAQCLRKDARERPGVAALAQHPFLCMHEGADLRQILKPVLGAQAAAGAVRAVAGGHGR